jgi:hypothetical protein
MARVEDFQSPSKVIKQISAQINRILRSIDLRTLGNKERKILNGLQQNLNDSRIYLQAYELSETREEQKGNVKIAEEWLEQARKNILSASEYDIFNAIDVAHLSALIDQIRDDLK